MSSIQDQDHRPLLLAGPSLGLRLAILSFAAVGLMVADHRLGYMGVVRDWLSVATYPFHWAVDAPSSGWDYLSETFRTRASLREENDRLGDEIRELRLRLMRFEALEQENLRLREARAGSARVAERYLVAEILQVDLDPYRQRVLIDKGSREGVFAGQAALDAEGVFGQVTRVGPVSAEVIMISDPAHAIPVQINRTGVRTIAVGLGQTGKLMLPYLPRNADIAEGRPRGQFRARWRVPAGLPGGEGGRGGPRPGRAAAVGRRRTTGPPRPRSGSAAGLVRQPHRGAGG